MLKDYREDILFLVTVAAFVTGVAFCIYQWEDMLCSRRALSQDLVAGDYLIGAGCIYTLQDGKKINEKNYRGF